MSFRIGSSLGAAGLLLAGATLNGSGHEGWSTAFAAAAGVLAVGAGVLHREWRLSIPLAGTAFVLTVVIAQFNPRQGDLVLQVVGLALLGAGGAIGGLAYRSLADTIDRQGRDLQLKHRAFLAATSDGEAAAPAGDMSALTSNIARQVGADIACCYLATGDSRQFVPQLPGVGLDGLHAMTINRASNGSGPLLASV